MLMNEKYVTYCKFINPSHARPMTMCFFFFFFPSVINILRHVILVSLANNFGNVKHFQSKFLNHRHPWAWVRCPNNAFYMTEQVD